jgi:hypothetical protein
MVYSTSYYWKVVTRDSHGAEAAGPVWKFTTRPSNYPPAAPSGPSPSNNATGLTNSLSLSWQCSDPDGDVLKYDVYFGTATAPPLVASNVANRTYNPGFLAVGTKHYWKIVAHDGAAETSGPVWSFTTASNHAPNAPSSPSPANNATQQALQVRVSWFCSDQDFGQALTYDVYFGLTSSPPLVVTNLTNQFWDTPALEMSKTYFWKIVARDPLGATALGAIWKFTTGPAQPPSGPSNPFPADGASFSLPFITLQWTAPSQYTAFQIFIGTTVPPPFAGISSTTAFNAGAVTPNNHYYWYVVASDGVSQVTGPLWSFFVTGGEVPVLFSHFDADVSGTAARIGWELRSDEAMDSYTLYRRADGASQSVALITAPISGTRGSYLDRDVEGSRSYHYEMLVRTTRGEEFRSQTVTVEMPALELTLGQNHPNPFNPQTTIPYMVPAGGPPARVRLSIYDMQGRAVRVLVNEDQTGGAREVVWNGSDESGSTVSSGIYFCVFQVGNERRTQKLVLLK